MSRPIFEVIALDAHDALAARTGGADRLELVTDMAADGLTPSRETFAAVRAAVDIPVRVMLRARADFAVGGTHEADALCVAAAALRGEGADEFVLGFLDGSGAPDLPAVRLLVDAIGSGARWTFHRAIDHCADREAVRSAVRGLPGLDTFLTAGSARGVDDGLGRLLAEAGRPGEPQLMVGGGLRAEHLPRLLAAGIDAFHVGGAVRPGGWAGPVDAEAVRTWRELLDAPVAVP
ncbi:copper homeostasis protein CutC [Actinacidiphila sp. bgisy160]|uniref:copper homeostasis protein CutC n=1 Tax=Actinacidiphila sp. bgisy160 TaxID=3413796 RepID=UPI003D71BAF5